MRAVSANEREIRLIAAAVAKLVAGGSNAIGSVTLTASAAETTVTSPVITTESRIVLMPLTANAAAEIQASPYCLITRAKGSFTISHVNNSQTDRDFDWVAIGG